MRHCDGRLYDGSACNNDLFTCSDCATSGCAGDGCDFQSFARPESCDCGGTLRASANGALRTLAAA